MTVIRGGEIAVMERERDGGVKEGEDSDCSDKERENENRCCTPVPDDIFNDRKHIEIKEDQQNGA